MQQGITTKENIKEIRAIADALTSKLDTLIDEAKSKLPENVKLMVTDNILDKEGKRFGWGGKYVSVGIFIDISDLP
jgi:hypothetical protein